MKEILTNSMDLPSILNPFTTNNYDYFGHALAVVGGREEGYHAN
jgi:hypothetical protein